MAWVMVRDVRPILHCWSLIFLSVMTFTDAMIAHFETLILQLAMILIGYTLIQAT